MKCGVMIMNQRDKWKKFIPVMAILAIAVILVLIVKISGEPLSVDTIVKYTPKNVALAVIMLILLFGLKSLTIVLPLSILYLASGILFSPVAAVFISTVGLSVSITIPYCLGKCSGKQITEEMKLAAANAIAGLVPEEELNENNILPEAFDPRVADTVSKAIKDLI